MKKSSYELRLQLDEAQQAVPIDSLWQHYKGGAYVVLGHTIDTDTGEVRVRYRRVGGPEFDAVVERSIEFVRPIEEWAGAYATLIGNTKRFTRVE